MCIPPTFYSFLFSDIDSSYAIFGTAPLLMLRTSRSLDEPEIKNIASRRPLLCAPYSVQRCGWHAREGGGFGTGNPPATNLNGLRSPLFVRSGPARKQAGNSLPCHNSHDHRLRWAGKQFHLHYGVHPGLSSLSALRAFQIPRQRDRSIINFRLHSATYGNT